MGFSNEESTIPCSYQTKQALPTNLNVCEGQRVTLSLPNNLWPWPCVQWQVKSNNSWNNIRRGNKLSLTFIANRNQDGYKYRAIVQSKCECWVTNSTILTVNYIAIIQPTSQQALIGGTVTFTSSGTGKPPVTRMWWEVSTDGGLTWSLIPGETSTSLTLTNVQANQCGNLYRAVFNNGCIQRSNPARLTVYRTLAYVTNNISNDVSVIDTSTNTVITTITVGNSPFGIAITPDGNFAYVTNIGSDNVSVIDTSTNMVIGSPILVGTSPFGIAITPDGNFVYITNSDSDNVSVIDTSTNAVITTIAVGSSPFGIAITPDGSFAYVTNFISDNVSVIDISTNTVITTIAVGNSPFGIAITPDGNFAYVTNRFDNNVSVIDTSTNTEILPRIPVGNIPQGIAIGNIPLC